MFSNTLVIILPKSTAPLATSLRSAWGASWSACSGEYREFIGNKSPPIIRKVDEPKIRAYVLDTVKRYATKPFMSNDDYERITNLIRSSFLDYIIQSHSTLNKEIPDLLLKESTNIATQLELVKSKYPGIS